MHVNFSLRRELSVGRKLQQSITCLRRFHPRVTFMLSVAAVIFTVVSAPTGAATEAPFTQPAFAAAQQEGKPLLIDISAPWCPTCAQQRPILTKLMANPEFKDLIVYQVDFDRQKDVVRALGAQMPSSLGVFHGAVEKDRFNGDTSAESSKALLQKVNG